MKILDILFGKKRTSSHKELGVFTSERIKKNSLDTHYTWYGAKNIKNASEKAFIVLEGDLKGPWSSNCDIVLQIVKNWESQYLGAIKLEYEKLKHEKISFEAYNKQLYFAAITNSDESPISPKFEVCLDHVDTDLSIGLSVSFKNDTITDITFYD